MGATTISTSQLISVDTSEYLVVHVVFPGIIWSWGAWKRTTEGRYQLALGPLSIHTSMAEGLKTIGISTWKTVDDTFPTPSELPLDDYDRASLGVYSPPKGSRVSIAAASFGELLSSWKMLRNRK